jgi:hypothetical protein
LRSQVLTQGLVDKFHRRRRRSREPEDSFILANNFEPGASIA